jgi:Protein of unknown function (DUF3987)/RepB DNA-primase from phage plasmid
VPTATPTRLREKFFDYLFDEQTGYLCIATAQKDSDPKKMRSSFKQTFFKWPDDKEDALDFITSEVPKSHLWYSVNLFSRAERKKEVATNGRIVYADLDACDPGIVEPNPTLVTETSPGRYQAIWRLGIEVGPDITEDYSRRIAYRYSINGADKSGWDTGQLLRIPYTRNYKYPGNPEIRILRSVEDLLPPNLFEQLEVPEISQNGGVEDEDMPNVNDLPDPDHILYKYESELKRKNIVHYYVEPEPTDDWSSLMWSLINTCFEAGMSELEVFSVAFNAKCNKYERDSRPIRYLWREVKKAGLVQKSLEINFKQFGYLTMPDIATEPATETFIDTYLNWATETTDAVPVFHELSAFMALSSLLSSTIRCEVSWGTLVPNLWGMILGESTLARKTTAMRLATELITYLDEEAILATDGSMEGLLTGLSLRPSRASIFFRDEISGFFEAVNRKDYLAGMVESMTHLYDSPQIFRRLLRKETIVVEKPILIFYGGGIREKVYACTTDEYILSGFLPRFLIVAGDTDIASLRSTKKRMDEDMRKRKAVFEIASRAYDRYNQIQTIKIGNQINTQPAEFQADLTDNAWTKFQDMERRITLTAYESHISQYALPVFERSSKSLLKMAVLLAAVRQEPKDFTLTVNEDDIQNAAYYVQRWSKHSIDMIYNAGKTVETRMLERVVGNIEREPGIYRSVIMRNYHLSKRSMDMIEDTLIDRGEIRKIKSGKGVRYWPI